MRILAIDYGERRIGLALSDPLGIISQGLETLPNRGRERFFEDLGRICAEHEVGEILLGLPVNLNGTVGPKAREALEIADAIRARLSLAVTTWDERLSSRQADRLMSEVGGLSERQRRPRTDRIAAIILLQSYLDSRRTGP